MTFDSDLVASDQYRRLIKAFGGLYACRHGWKSILAKKLGVSPSYLTKVGDRSIKVVGAENRRKALSAFSLDPDYFNCARDPRESELLPIDTESKGGALSTLFLDAEIDPPTRRERQLIAALEQITDALFDLRRRVRQLEKDAQQ